MATNANRQAAIRRYRDALESMNSYAVGPRSYEREEDDTGYQFLEEELYRAAADVPLWVRLRWH